ncbi:TIGR03943 family protein [Streptomyces sp. NPDC086077]|uniref:TIGR03943 family putative permease subunit n=1 Tax=Streptomyces sp. NPDC086077 TaxID=3154862 RepID=UPI00342CC325
MKRPLQAVLLVLSGTSLLYLSLFTDLYLRYVKEWMRPLLIASGALLLLLGLLDAWSQRRAGRGEPVGEHPWHRGHDGHGHDHSQVPRAAWLLFLPALSILFYAPPALGAYTASRQASKPVVEQNEFDPLPAMSPLPLTLRDFTSRVQQDREQAIKGRSVQMTGFVTPSHEGQGWDLTRLLINCCAADAQAVKVRIHGTPAPAANTWVTVVGTWHAGGTLGTGSASVALDARSVTKVERPTNAYMDALPLPLRQGQRTSG